MKFHFSTFCLVIFTVFSVATGAEVYEGEVKIVIHSPMCRLALAVDPKAGKPNSFYIDREEISSTATLFLPEWLSSDGLTLNEPHHFHAMAYSTRQFEIFASGPFAMQLHRKFEHAVISEVFEAFSQSKLAGSGREISFNNFIGMPLLSPTELELYEGMAATHIISQVRDYGSPSAEFAFGKLTVEHRVRRNGTLRLESSERAGLDRGEIATIFTLPVNVTFESRH